MDRKTCLPNSLQMHWSNLDNVSDLFTLQNAIAAATSHASNIQQLCPVDHMIIWIAREC